MPRSAVQPSLQSTGSPPSAQPTPHRYKCDKCRALVRARKRVAIWDEPNVLVVHLKRFSTSPFGYSGGKVGRHVEFTLSLDLAPYSAFRLLAGTAGGGDRLACARYDLVGVLVHQGGSVHSGHYYAYVRDSSGRWSCANDETVYRVSMEHVLQQQAYMLFYTRSEVKAPRHPPQQPQVAGSPQPHTSPTMRTVGPQPAPMFGPQLPPSAAAGQPAKRARIVADQPLDFDSGWTDGLAEAGPKPDVGPKQKQPASTTLVQPSTARTTVLPAKQQEPARPPLQPRQQQQQQGASDAKAARSASGGLLPPVATFKVKPLAGAGQAALVRQGSKEAPGSGHAVLGRQGSKEAPGAGHAVLGRQGSKELPGQGHASAAAVKPVATAGGAANGHAHHSPSGSGVVKEGPARGFGAAHSAKRPQPDSSLELPPARRVHAAPGPLPGAEALLGLGLEAGKALIREQLLAHLRWDDWGLRCVTLVDHSMG